MRRGFASFQAYAWVSILAANPLVLARHVLAAQRWPSRSHRMP